MELTENIALAKTDKALLCLMNRRSPGIIKAVYRTITK